MNDNLFEVALYNRFIRKVDDIDNFDDRFFIDLISRLGIEFLQLIRCNTIQKRSCFSLVNDTPYIVIDTYIFELFDIINGIICCDDKKLAGSCLENLFNRLYAEECYLNENYQHAIVAASKYKHNQTYPVTKNDFLNQEAQALFTLFHEVYHYYFYRFPDQLQCEITLKESFYVDVLAYTNEKLSNEVQAELIKFLGNMNSREENICDILAAIQVIRISHDLKISINVASINIVFALYDQFSINLFTALNNSAIREMNNEFDARLIFLISYLQYYLETISSASAAKRFTNEANDIAEKWFNLIILPFFSISKRAIDECQMYDDNIGDRNKVKQTLKHFFRT